MPITTATTPNHLDRSPPTAQPRDTKSAWAETGTTPGTHRLVRAIPPLGTKAFESKALTGAAAGAIVALVTGFGVIANECSNNNKTCSTSCLGLLATPVVIGLIALGAHVASALLHRKAEAAEATVAPKSPSEEFSLACAHWRDADINETGVAIVMARIRAFDKDTNRCLPRAEIVEGICKLISSSAIDIRVENHRIHVGNAIRSLLEGASDEVVAAAKSAFKEAVRSLPSQRNRNPQDRENYAYMMVGPMFDPSVLRSHSRSSDDFC